MVAERPIFAAIAWAMSMSKPTACWVAGSVDSWGGYVVSERKVMVPGRTRLVGGVMFGGVGLTMANAELEGVVLTTPGPGSAHAPSVEARRALSARRPTDAIVISLPLALAGVLNMIKVCDPILRPVALRGTSAAAAL